MKVKISDLVLLDVSARIKPEEGIEYLIANIRETNGNVNPITITPLEWKCSACPCETSKGDHCDECGTEANNRKFVVLEGWRRVKACQFLDIQEMECRIV